MRRTNYKARRQQQHMASMLIIHSDGSADPLRVEPEEFLKYAEYCTVVAAQLWGRHREWEKEAVNKVAEAENIVPTPVGPVSENGHEPLSADS